VELSPEALKFDFATRRLELTGLGKTAMGKDGFQRRAKQIMADMKMRTKEELVGMISGKRANVSKAIQELVDDGTFDPVAKKGSGWYLQYIPEIGVDPRELVANNADKS
jgi:hypothetical protein